MGGSGKMWDETGRRDEQTTLGAAFHSSDFQKG